ncbi:MAG TPA: alpha/beta hydrolase-fold protein [Hanamia sp.]|jgi:predicted alpha/beta superfamily hydrolase|nr:alpha/beta hydrolase-fold protein [Hanamia sp.]
MLRLKKQLFVALLLFISTVSFAQYKVMFLVKQPSLLHSMDHIFIAGNFNVWNPADKNSQLHAEQNGILSVTLSLPAGDYEYKFTRGSWEKVETDSAGNTIQNRTLKLKSDTTLYVNILGWNDDFKQNIPSSKKNNTASAKVKIMDTAFYMPQLKRTRRIWLYLPPGYANSKKKYPVLYMHDGQNLFEEKTSYSGEWGVDEYLDSIFKKRKQEVIVVGIDNGNFKRMQEYNPWEFQSFGKGEGDKYVDFLVKTLKPYIDKHYRTLKDKANTFIAGSSMGGLISLYAVLKYPQVYGGAGIFSPAFWTASGIDSTTITDAKNVNSRLFFYAGGKEGDSMVPDMKRIEKEIEARSKSPVKEMIDPNARHNEAAWRKYFPDFYEWVIEK